MSRDTTFENALDAALTFLGHRPRSEREVRDRLARKGIEPALADAVLERLRRLDLVDDAAFAAYWVEQRQTFRPRGARVLKAELRQRGVNADLAAAATRPAEVAADDGAHRAAEKRARQLVAQGCDERKFRLRLGQFLGRRGFGWDTIAPVVERLWQEYGVPTA